MATKSKQILANERAAETRACRRQVIVQARNRTTGSFIDDMPEIVTETELLAAFPNLAPDHFRWMAGNLRGPKFQLTGGALRYDRLAVAHWMGRFMDRW